ncbi:MAG: hypothetical protein HZC55_27100 [Verrucomicrobia bacterium]|nr:hypothetical protein [Verrucomicrobiota bacterium]
MKLRHLRTRLSRLDTTDAAREASALKAQFRREDEELYRQGRGAEVLADRMKNLGMSASKKTRLLTVNGTRIGTKRDVPTRLSADWYRAGDADCCRWTTERELR